MSQIPNKADLSIDQANQLDLLLSQDMQEVPGIFAQQRQYDFNQNTDVSLIDLKTENSSLLDPDTELFSEKVFTSDKKEPPVD